MKNRNKLRKPKPSSKATPWLIATTYGLSLIGLVAGTIAGVKYGKLDEGGDAPTAQIVSQDIVVKGTTYSTYKQTINNRVLEFIDLPSYQLTVVTNQFETADDGLEEAHTGFADYSSGKDGFFNIRYLNLGYVKLDYEGRKLYAGYTSTSATTKPALIPGRTEHLEIGSVLAVGGSTNIYIDITEVLRYKSGTGGSTILVAALQNEAHTLYNVCANKKPTDRTNMFFNPEGTIRDSYTFIPDSSVAICKEPTATSDTEFSVSFPFFKDIITDERGTIVQNSVFLAPKPAGTTTVVGDVTSAVHPNLHLVIEIKSIAYVDHPLFGRISIDTNSTYDDPNQYKDVDDGLPRRRERVNIAGNTIHMRERGVRLEVLAERGITFTRS